MTNTNRADVIAAIGNTIAAVEIDSVIYSLAADAVVRVNDADTGFCVNRIAYPSMSKAVAAYNKAVADAEKVAQ